ncbi:acyltransferase family protein [Hyphomonas sp. BRH_c22]|uniref:acyltransferase family protein n=1 Tax=Hyphomonas sp. BRH_c22 TaxID=1629710 RepID=UPI000A8CB13D|nr:acyltransferase family protein [Hyphomonas sp. BRH_c22]
MPLERINWIDHAKGVCIVLIVAMYATSGYTDLVGQSSWMNAVVAWAEPALMPAFFFLSALFLNLSVFGPTRHFLDRKILHFAYFYMVWLLIQNLALAPLAFPGAILTALVSPPDSLLLVYMLIVFHAVTRLFRFLPTQKVFVFAALLQVAFATGWIDTGWIVANQLGAWFVFFYAGFVAAPHVFELADRVNGHAQELWKVLLGWAAVNAAFVALNVSDLPLISLALGFAGTGAIIALGLLLCRIKWLAVLGHAGRHCLVIYLTFSIPVIVLQHALAANGRVGDAGLACLVITLGGVAMPLIFHRLVRATPLNFVYKRPGSLRLRNARNHSKASLLPPPPTSASKA